MHALSGDLRALRRPLAAVPRIEGPCLVARDLPEFHASDYWELHLRTDRERRLWLDRSHHFRVLLQCLAAVRGRGLREGDGRTIAVANRAASRTVITLRLDLAQTRSY